MHAKAGRTAMSKPHLRRLFGVLCLLVLVVLVERLYGWRNVLTPWTELSPSAVLVAIVFLFASYLLRAIRLFHYFHAELCGAFATCVKLMLQHNMYNNLMPMRSGELSFPILMSRYFGIAAARSLPALLWFRALDLHTVIGLALVVGVLIRGELVLGALLAPWVPLPWLLFAFAHRLRAAITPRGPLSKMLATLIDGLPGDAGKFLWSWFWSVANWLVKLCVFAWVMLEFADLGYVAAWVGATLGELTTVLPVNGVAGAGTYEAGVVAGMLPFGVSAQTALPVAVNLHLFILAASLIGGGVAFLMPVAKSGSRSD